MKALKVIIIALCLLAAAAVLAPGQAAAQRRFPAPQFEAPYEMPETAWPAARAMSREVVDVAVLFVALGVAAYIALKARSRRAMFVLSVLALAYFGFYRRGCVCPIGAIQNVTAGLALPGYVVPVTVALFFALPLVFALLFGRVFCSGVCPLGAIQEVVLIKPVRVPQWLDRTLGVVPFLYLGAAVMFTVTDTLWIICRYDPFVAFFRLGGDFPMLIAGGVVLISSAFIGRPYCRWLCPYGVPLLGTVSRVSWRRTSITPDECVNCTLCHKACPYGAIEPKTPEGVHEA